MDEGALLAAAQAEGGRLWRAIPDWHWSARTLDDVAPMTYPVRG